MTPEFKDWVDRAKAVSIDSVLRQRKITLKGKSGKLAGPCPHCGGDDRFGVTLAKQAFHCRGCGKGGYGAITLVQFLDGTDFVHAVEHLTGQPPPKDKPSIKKQRKPVEQLGPVRATYDYTDETDTVLFQVLRYSEPKKTFRQRRPDPDHANEWISNTDGVRLVPYKLLDLIEAIANDYVVYIVEGEKDVLTAIEKLGVPATTNPMGIAKGWQASYNEFFQGADVVIIPDNDRDRSKGHAHASNIARNLREVAARVRMLLLPEAVKDLSEWVEAGGTIEQFNALTEQAPEYINGGGGPKTSADGPPEQVHEQPTAPVTILSKAQFLAQLTLPDFLVDGLLQRRFIYALTGQTGHAKTAVALLIAQLVSSTDNNAMLGTRKVGKGRVIYFVGENPDDVRYRVVGSDAQRTDDPARDNISFIPGIFNIGGMIGMLKADCERNGEAALIVVDTSAAYFLGNEELSNTQMGGYARTLRLLTTLPGGPCVLVLCHPIKHVIEPSQLLPRGGGAYLAEMDGNLTLWRLSDDVVEMHHTKIRGPGFQAISFKLETVTSTKLMDKKGRPFSTVRAVVITQREEEQRLDQDEQDEDRVLAAMLANPADGSGSIVGSFGVWAQNLGWVNQQGEPYKKKVERIVTKLAGAKPKLTVKQRHRWALTEQGKGAAQKAAMRFEHERQRAGQGRLEL